jgi:6-phosphogluconolactonase
MGFTSNETGGGISAWKFDNKTGQLTLNESLSSLPPGWEGASYAADIKITPNGRFAYVSNCDGRKLDAGMPHGDTLAAFEINQKSGNLSVVGHYATHRFPRSFCFDVTGNFLFAASELENKLDAFRVDQKTGALKHLETGIAPIWVTCWRIDSASRQ